jgi:hypothetical protein
MSRFKTRVRARGAVHASSSAKTGWPSAAVSKIITESSADSMLVCDVRATSSLCGMPVPHCAQRHTEGGLPW